MFIVKVKKNTKPSTSVRKLDDKKVEMKDYKDLTRKKRLTYRTGIRKQWK
jgi:hypothetical protein